MKDKKIKYDKMIDEIYYHNLDSKSNPITFIESQVSAGFPSSAENYIDKALDLNDLIIKHPSATYFIRVKGDSMIDDGIKNGDILIVDRALSISNNKIVIARINDEYTVKRVKIDGQRIFLMPGNKNYQPIEIKDDMECDVMGVVTFIIHQT